MKTAGIFCLVAIASFMFISCGGSSSPSNTAPEELAPPAGMITGKVLSDSSSDLFKSFSSPVPPGQIPVAGALCSLTDKPSIASVTDSEGVFRLSNVPRGVHLVLCTKAGPSGKNFAILQAAEVREGQGVDLGFVILRPTGQIQGSVNALGLLDLIAIDIFIPGTSFIAKTDAAGGFIIGDVPAGTYTLRAQKDVHRFRDVPNVEVLSGQETGVGVIELNFNNRTPIFTSLPPTEATVLTAWSYAVIAADPDEDPLTIAVASGPAGMMVTGNVITWTPTCLQIGSSPVSISVSDPFGGVSVQSFHIAVVNPNEGGVPENPCRVLKLVEGIPLVRGIALDVANVYWAESDGSKGEVKKIPKEGGAIFILASVEPGPSTWSHGIAADDTHLYWGAGNCQGGCGNPAVQRVSKEEGPASTLSTGEPGTLIALDNQHIYFSEVQCGWFLQLGGFYCGGVKKVPKNGGPTVVLKEGASAPIGRPWGVAVDAQFVYWTEEALQCSGTVSGTNFVCTPDPGGNRVMKASKLDGSGLVSVASGLRSVWLSPLILDGTKLYFIERDSNSETVTAAILSVDTSCTSPTCTPSTVVSGRIGISDLAVDGPFIYWSEIGSDPGKSTGAVVKMPIGGGAVDTVAGGLVAPRSVAVDQDHVYWAETNSIKKALK